MKAVLQRVSQASVKVEGSVVAEIGQGLLILLGIGPEDDLDITHALVDKIMNLRIFEDDGGRMNLSILDSGGAAMVVSQFTLYADTSRGRRPSFIGAAKPDQAEPLVEAFAERMRAQGIPSKTGIFGAHMEVALVNDGPVTIVMEY